MNALDLLHDDHQLFRRILADGEDASAVSEREDLLGSLSSALIVHEQLEEELLYPVVREIDPATVRAATEGHLVAGQMIDQLRAVVGSAEWADAVDAARGRLEDHLAQEEREVFHVARAVLGSDGLETLGDGMGSIRDATIR
jgi:hemerythrin superfamily protein